MKKVLTTALIVALAACAQSDVTVQAPEQNPSTTGLTDPEPGPEREPEPELDPSLLELTLAEVTAGPVGDEASFTINDRIAEIDVDEEAELVLEVVSGPEPTQREGRFVVPLVAPHATLEYRAFVQTLSGDGRGALGRARDRQQRADARGDERDVVRAGRGHDGVRNERGPR